MKGGSNISSIRKLTPKDNLKLTKYLKTFTLTVGNEPLRIKDL